MGLLIKSTILISVLGIPQVPNLPFGVPVKNIREWEQLSPACKDRSFKAIKPCLQSFVDYGSLIGAVTLVDRKGSLIQTDAVGAYNESAIFQIQSMSKPFVSVAIMILVDRGKIPSIESRVSELPGFHHYPYRDVTVKELLTHTAGIWPVHEDKDGVSLGASPYYRNRLDKEPEITVRDKSLEFVAQHYANPKLYPLGPKTFAYSNAGFITLGWIVERLTGVPFEQFLKKNVIDILGMKDTFIFPSKASHEQRVRIANVDRRPPDALDVDDYDKTRPGWKYPSPEAGLYSTASDLRRFLMLFRHRGKVPGHQRILSERSIEQLLGDRVPKDNFGCEGQIGRSLGFFVVRTGGCFSQPGLDAGTIFHPSRFLTFYWYNPVKDEIGVFLEQKVASRNAMIRQSSFGEREAFMQMLERIKPN
jgi:CubicO group peptidase (beta-lactamase class C family)